MKPIHLLFTLSILSFSCISNKTSPKHKQLSKECKDIELLLKEFASKLKPIDDISYTFLFEEDSLKHANYGYINGKKHFLDYRINEVFHYEHHLTNEYKTLDSNSIKCIQQLHKSDVINLFGKPSSVNDVYREISYGICIDGNTKEKCFNMIILRFDSKWYLEEMLISIYHF